MKTVIIGYGYMGQIRKQVVENLPDLKLCGICDPLVLPGQIGTDCAHYEDYRDAIDDVRPDIVFVCTPNRYTPDVCIYALEQGCHVFCEKPPGRNLTDIQRIIEVEQKHPDLKLMFGFNHRYHPAIVEAKALVDAGRLGRILWIRGVYGKSGGRGKEFEASWRNDPAISGGGILLDQGVHMLDLFRFFCGEFQEVLGLLSTAFWSVPVEDNAFVVLRNDQGQIAQLHSSATLWKHTFRLELGLEKAYLIVEGLLSKTGSYGREKLIIGRRPGDDEDTALGNPREEIVYFDKDLSWDFQVRELVNCIKHSLPVTDSSSHDALRVMEVIDAIYTQAQSKGPLVAVSIGNRGMQ